VLTPEQKKCMVWDVERGVPDQIQNEAWQTCTCIGDWHYSRAIYDNNGYKSAKTVVQMLIDIVSKNGNLLLNIPVRGDGSIDDKEIAILEEIAKWMDVNKESIFDTRPWKVFGEGPIAETSNPIKDAGFNEGKASLTEKDIRFNQKGNLLYVSVMGAPSEDIIVKSLGKAKENRKIKSIKVLGSNEKISWKQNNDSLAIAKPKVIPNAIAVVFKIQY